MHTFTVQEGIEHIPSVLSIIVEATESATSFSLPHGEEEWRGVLDWRTLT